MKRTRCVACRAILEETSAEYCDRCTERIRSTRASYKLPERAAMERKLVEQPRYVRVVACCDGADPCCEFCIRRGIQAANEERARKTAPLQEHPRSDWMRKWRVRRRAEGMCSRCSNEARPGLVTCVVCAEQQAETRRAKRRLTA